MPNRFAAPPNANKFRNASNKIDQLEVFASATINGGMVTQFDAADLQDNQLTLAINANSRYDAVSRRSGFNILTPVKPDSNKIIGFVTFKDNVGNVSFYRFTRGAVYLRGVGAWTAVTGAALTATDNNKVTCISINNRLFFSNQVNVLQEVNVGANTYAPAGNAHVYKYYCAFGNRIIGAYRVDGTPNPVEIGWSGDFNFTEWSSLVDPSAGSEPLIINPEDFADYISGIFGFADKLLVLREQSVWQGDLLPVASQPFFFTNKVPNIGCDSPFTAQRIPNGIAWYDRRLNNIFIYRINDPVPTPIGDTIRKTLKDQIVDNTQLFSSYDSVNDEYLLGVPVASSSVVRVWKYNFKTQAWTYDEVINVCHIVSSAFAQSTGKINDLVGKINQLVGKINDLSPSVNIPTMFYGKTDGDIIGSNEILDADNETSYTFDVRSKLFRIPTIDTYVAQLHIEYTPRLTGNFTISYSKDGGLTFNTYKTIAFGVANVGKRLTIVCNKNIRASTYVWRVTSTSGLFDLIGFTAFVFPGAGYTRNKTS